MRRYIHLYWQVVVYSSGVPGYLKAFAGKLSPWTAVPGWSLNLTFKDVMHVVCLGCARDSIATHIVVWLESDMLNNLAVGVPAPPHLSRASHLLNMMWLNFKVWAKANGHGFQSGVPLNLVTLSRSSQTSYPELSSQFKAAVVQILISYVGQRFQ